MAIIDETLLALSLCMAMLAWIMSSAVALVVRYIRCWKFRKKRGDRYSDYPSGVQLNLAAIVFLLPVVYFYQRFEFSIAIGPIVIPPGQQPFLLMLLLLLLVASLGATVCLSCAVDFKAHSAKAKRYSSIKDALGTAALLVVLIYFQLAVVQI